MAEQRQNTLGLAETRRLMEGTAERQDRISESLSQVGKLVVDIAAQQERNTRGLVETRGLIRDLANVVEGLGEFVSTHVKDRSAHS